MKRALIVILLVTSFSVLGVAQTAIVSAKAPEFSVSQVFWGSAAAMVQPEPGDKNVNLNIVIRNVDSVTMSAVTSTLFLHGSPFTTPTGESVAVSGVSSIPAGTTATLVFMLNIDAAAELKTYDLVMEVESRTTQYLTGVSSSVRVPVPLFGEVKFFVSSTPETVSEGFNDFTVKIMNRGQAKASNVEVSINTPETAYDGNDLPLVLIGQDNGWSFTEITPSGEISINMKLYASNEAIGKAYSITIALSYDDGYGFHKTEQMRIGLVAK